MEVQLASLKNIPIAGRSGSAPVRVGNGVYNDLWMGNDGASVNLPWKQALVLEGRCFTVQVGALVTGIASGSGTVPELAEPEFIISVPTGAAIIPLRIRATCHPADAVSAHDKMNIIFGWDRGKAYDGTGTHVTEIAYNLRGDNPKATVCTCTSAHTDDITSIPVMLSELARKDIQFDLTTSGAAYADQFELTYEPEAAPVLVGPAMLVGMWGGTAALTGYAQIFWAEFTKAELGF